jgi:glyoxylase-like metal-dependent hydrolase (beta-lactamase superfamily II)/predicted DCC family thiol-disulfide oxidoreductase YuxK
MPPPSVTGIAQEPAVRDTASAAYTVLYDGQCEICQAGVSWLRILDRRQRTDCVPLSAEALARLGPRLRMEDCLRQLHVVAADGRVYVGWDAVACLARLCPATWLAGVLGQLSPFCNFGRLLYGFVAANRYSLSKCRGGACRIAKPDAVRRQARLGAFWSCYLFGFLLRLPLVVWAGIKAAAQRTSLFARTWHRRVELLDGKLTILFLNGTLPNAVPLLFGELFTTVLYDGIAVDPGSPKMRRSLARHLRQLRPKIVKVVATHAHEEHVGNLNWLADSAGAPLYVSEMTARFLMPFKKLPWVRAAIIGQPPNLEPPFRLLGETLESRSGRLQVIATPGHCDDHVVLYDPEEKVLLAGDAFMGSYFATPNPDVDSRKWLASLERLMELDIEILIEGHGHVHTLRRDIPDFAGVVIRQDPKLAIVQKLEYLRWLRAQIEAGLQSSCRFGPSRRVAFPGGSAPRGKVAPRMNASAC